MQDQPQTSLFQVHPKVYKLFIYNIDKCVLSIKFINLFKNKKGVVLRYGSGESGCNSSGAGTPRISTITLVSHLKIN